MNTTAVMPLGVQASAAATSESERSEPVKLLRRVGSTTYTVNVYFSNNTSETLEDKILRLARNEGLDFQSGTARSSLRTERLPERRPV